MGREEGRAGGRRTYCTTWGTACGRPQRSILAKLCMCTMSSTTYLALPRWWLVSASPCTLCYSPCPETFPRRLNLGPTRASQQPGRLTHHSMKICDTCKDFKIDRSKGFPRFTAHILSPLARWNVRSGRWVGWYGPNVCFATTTNYETLAATYTPP